MKKYARIVQADARGQIVIPKDIRSELHISEGTGFLLYVIENEGIFLKTTAPKKLSEHHKAIAEFKQNASKLKLGEENLDKSIKYYDDQSSKNLEQV